MFKQMWANYVQEFAQNPEYCAKVYLVVCGCLGGTVAAALNYRDKCKELRRVVAVQKLHNDLLEGMISKHYEEEK